MSTVESNDSAVIGNSSNENDLASVACLAAVELDDLLLDRTRGLEGVKHLAMLISESMPVAEDSESPNWLLDPAAFVAVNGAISDAKSRAPIESVLELVKEAEGIVAQFQSVARDPVGFMQESREKVIAMRTFCLALSRRASATRKPSDEWTSKHPFRR